VIRRLPGSRGALLPLLLLAGALGAVRVEAQSLLVPMDRAQANHLKAYGLTFVTLQAGGRGEWLLNYRGGSFLLPDNDGVRREAALRGVTIQAVGAAEIAAIRAVIAESNMESVTLETAPRIAIYTPPNSAPWDDAVTMALTYAGIEYETIWDPEVLADGLGEYEWLHLHHEDFTGQYSKFYMTYAGAPWLQEEVARNQEVARRLGYGSVPELKKAVARKIRDFVQDTGMLFPFISILNPMPGTKLFDDMLAEDRVPLGPDERDRARALICDSGAIDLSLERARRYADDAGAALEVLTGTREEEHVFEPAV